MVGGEADPRGNFTPDSLSYVVEFSLTASVSSPATAYNLLFVVSLLLRCVNCTPNKEMDATLVVQLIQCNAHSAKPGAVKLVSLQGQP